MDTQLNAETDRADGEAKLYRPCRAVAGRLHSHMIQDVDVQMRKGSIAGRDRGRTCCYGDDWICEDQKGQHAKTLPEGNGKNEYIFRVVFAPN